MELEDNDFGIITMKKKDGSVHELCDSCGDCLTCSGYECYCEQTTTEE